MSDGIMTYAVDEAATEKAFGATDTHRSLP
jgi:hypothetical protein